MKFQLLHKAVAGLLGSCAGVLLLTTLIVRGNPHVKKRLQLHLLGITCWVCQAQNENDTERILHAANHRLVRFTFMNGGIQASLSMLLVLHCIFASKFLVITMYGGYTIFLLNTRGGWAYFGSKEVTVIFALSWHTLGYIGRRWLSKLEQPVFGNTLTKLYQNCLIAVFLSSLQTPMQRMGYVVLNMVCFSLLGPLLLVHLHLNLKTLAGLLSDKCWSDNTYVQLILSGALGIHILAMWLGSNHVLITFVFHRACCLVFFHVLSCIHWENVCNVFLGLGSVITCLSTLFYNIIPIFLDLQVVKDACGIRVAWWMGCCEVTGGLSWFTRSTNDWMTHIWHNMQHSPLHKRFPILTRFGLPFGKQYESLLARCIPNNKPNSLKGHATPWQQYKDIKMLGQVLLPSLEVLFKFATVVILTSFCRRFSFNGKHLFIFCYARRQGQVAQTRQASTFGRSYC